MFDSCGNGIIFQTLFWIFLVLFYRKSDRLEAQRRIDDLKRREEEAKRRQR